MQASKGLMIGTLCFVASLLQFGCGGEPELQDGQSVEESGAELRRGKGGKTPPATQPATAVVALVSANPVPVGTAPTFHATGYQPGQLVYMVMSGYIVADYVYADGTGSLTYTFGEPMWSAGGFTFTTALLNGVNSASVSFTVQ